LTTPHHFTPGSCAAAWRKRDADGENDREPDLPHWHLGGDGWKEVSRMFGRAPGTVPHEHVILPLG
jgi:hypothetical protein